MVNYSVTEACDWWTYGVIVYELCTLTKFSSYNEMHHIYSNNVKFPDDYSCEASKDLIKKLLRRDPRERCTASAIQTHEFFAGVDWVSLEQSFWQ
jgi:serine/threonine protein kinase